MTNKQECDIINNKLQPFLALQQQWSGLILGGSLALIIQKKLPYRNTLDVDLVGHRYHEFPNQEICQMGSSIDETDCLMIKIDGKPYDFFINPFVIYHNVIFQDVKIKVQHPAQIMSAKMKYYDKYKIVKHRDDIIAYFDIQKNGYKELTEEQQAAAKLKQQDDDLPF